MFSNASILILQNMEKAEFKAMCTFMDRRLSHKTKEYQLFKHLCDCYPKFKKKDLQSDLLIHKLTKGKAIANPNKYLSNIGNRLSKIMEEHLVERSLQLNWQDSEFLLVSEYSRCGMTDLMDKRIEQYLNVITKPQSSPEPDETTAFQDSTSIQNSEASKGLNVWSHLTLYRMYHLRYYSRNTIKTAANEPSLAQCMEQLELAYLAAKLRIALEMAMVTRITGKQPITQLSEVELERIKALADNDFYFYLYLLAHDLVIQPSEHKYQTLKRELFQNGRLLSKDEHGNLLTTLINYASAAILMGQLEYYAEAAALHHYGLNSEVLLQDDKIAPELLLNIVNLTCEAGQLDTAKALLDKWKVALPSELREEALVALDGRIYFYNRQFDEAAAQISKIKRYKNHLMELSARTTTLQSYYEAGAYQAIESFAGNFTKALNRYDDRFSENYQLGFGHFVKMVQSMVQVQLDPNLKADKKKEKLKEKIRDYAMMACKNWVLDKIEKLN